MKFLNSYIIILVFVSQFVKSQELPPIIKFNSNYYKAGSQNWMIDQDKSEFIYFANNEGLLEFNGTEWKLYPSPNETILRSVKVVGNKIYTGCYMEFGYWSRVEDGSLKYSSLSNKIKSKLIEDEHFWNIVAIENWVLFQSFNRIYVYNIKDQSFRFIDNHPYIFRVFNTNNSIYFQAINEGLYEIVNGESILICNNEQIKTNRIVEIFPSTQGLLLQTERAGLLKFKDNKLEPFDIVSNEIFKINSIFCAKKLSNGGFALGTISNGIFILDKQGKIQNHITQNTGLSNNTILSIDEDVDNNIWLGLDNGIDCINLQSPVRNYQDDKGYLGTVYTSIEYQDNLYLGTNQGLFFKKKSSNGEFLLINGTKGQVWSLFIKDNQLFCGHDLGTFLINQSSAQLIFKGTGTWKFNSVPNNPNYIMQGNYNGLSILEKINSNWVFKTKVKGFDISSRYFEIDNDNTIYVGHEYKGVIKVIPSKDFLSIKKFSILKKPSKGKHVSLAKFNGSIFHAGKQGIFKLNSKTKEFELDKKNSLILNQDEYVSGKLNVDKSGKMWFFTKSYIYYFTAGNFNSELKVNKIPIPFSIVNPMLGYENITQLSGNEYLVGKTDGYFIIDLNDFKVKNHKVAITDVSVNRLEGITTKLSINKTTELKHDQNNISIKYTVPQYNRFVDVEYQYILEGFQSQWSQWNTKSEVNFKNLEPGEYTFRVRAKIANAAPENVAVYHFVINKPWYATTLALLIYLILFIILAYYINKAYQQYYHKQKIKLIEENNLLLEIAALENEQQLMKMKNEQLSQDVDAKNRELAVSNMSLIKKDELLAIIKEDLKKSSEGEGNNRSIKSVITTINKNISNDDTWTVFKEAFDSADKDFLKKMKAKHTTLTPSDLKLCAYLRLNLSSKEIAPMLNISIRSVEIKRYRLRKKLNLAHDESLVDYILSI